MTNTDVIRSKCINDFSFFTRYIFKKTHKKKFVLGEHHSILFDQATKISNYEQGNTIFNIAPRYSKTEIMVKMFISWRLAIEPKARFIHLSYSDQLALDNSEEIKDIIQSDVYQELFPYVQIKKDSRAKNKWYTTLGGGVLARSSAGQVTGFGAGIVDEYEDFEVDKLFGGAIIIDDPLKPDEAISETLRDRVNNRYNTTIKNRINSRDTPIIVIMQRLHPNDLSGFLLEQEPDRWTVTSMPVIKEDGSALWSFKHTIEELLQLQKEDKYTFNTQYLQDPRPIEGFLFPKESLNYYHKLPDSAPICRVSFVDIADEGTDNHSAPVGYVYENGDIYIPEVLFTKLSIVHNVQMTANLINSHKLDYARIENNFGGSAYILLIEKLIETTQLFPSKATTNKHSRILTSQFLVTKHVYFKADYTDIEMYSDFMKNIFDYQSNGKSKHDDAPDSLEGLVSFVRAIFPHLY